MMSTLWIVAGCGEDDADAAAVDTDYGRGGYCTLGALGTLLQSAHVVHHRTTLA